MKYVVFMCLTIQIFLFQTGLGWTIQPAFFAGRKEQLLLTFLTMFTLWSRITSNIYTLIGQIWQVS